LGNRLVGWSPITKRWSAPAPAARSYGELDFVVTPEGSCWLAAQSAEVALVGYFPNENRWEQIAPPEGKREEQTGVRLLAADDEAFWVSSPQGLWCYRRKTKTWEKSSLEPPWDVLRNSSLRTAPAGNGMWWVAAPQGLWRFDPVQQKFSEATLLAGSGFTPLHLKAVTPTAVWAMKGSLLARLDRQSGTAQLYGRESGVPESLTTRLRAAGGTVWLIEPGQPLYVFHQDGKPISYPLPPEQNERSRGWQAVTTDPADPTRVILATAALYRASLDRLDTTPLVQPEGTREIHDLLTWEGWVYVVASDGLWRFSSAQKWERLLPYSFGELQLDPDTPSIIWARSGQYPGSFSNQLARLDTTTLGMR
uniref:hypothetical protein n=1 Tax=Armatimonas sp. TaxID=1872638 RepID=UPI00286D3A10